MTEPSDSRTFLRHTLATIAYRGGKAFRNAPPQFSSFRLAAGSRSSGEILAHIGDLFDWVLSTATGRQTWRDTPPRTWEEDVDRFFAALKALDDYLASNNELHSSPEQLFQGGVADSLTHIGQIGMLRRLAGSPVKGESYYRSKIKIGSVGPEQEPAVREFD